MEFSSFEGGITFHLSDVQSSYTLQQKSVANVHLLMLICNEILPISSLKMLFHIDRYCQVLILIHEHIIFIVDIHQLEDIDNVTGLAQTHGEGIVPLGRGWGMGLESCGLLWPVCQPQPLHPNS